MKEIKKITCIYFSPTGKTEEVAGFMTKMFAELLEVNYEMRSYTLPEERKKHYIFGDGELVIWASPVYAGRIPNKTLEYIASAMEGHGTYAVPVAVYGNRNFDNALAEMWGILKRSGFLPVGGAAIAARHTFSEVLAAGRPDAADYERICEFCEKLVQKLRSFADSESKTEPEIPGEQAPTAYYVPKKENGEPAKFLKARPKVREDSCVSCGLCETVCPMGSIKMESSKTENKRSEDCLGRSLPIFEGICIKCQACIRKCPKQAIYMDDADFLSHVKMLEQNYMERKEPAFYL